MLMLTGLALAEELPADLAAAMAAGQGTGPCRIAAPLPQTGMITLRSGKYRILLNAASGYTIGEVWYDGHMIATPAGAQGTVILTEQGKESARDKTFKGDPWIGTAHGGEVVHDVTCSVDDQPRPLTVDGEIAGERIVIEKTHTLYRFAGQYTLTMTPDGYEERQVLRPAAPFADLHYLYLFMHPWMPTTTTYLAAYPDGTEETGQFGENRGLTFHQNYKRAPRWFALYDPTLNLGILQFCPQPIPGSALVQVRERYHKHYNVLPVKDRRFTPGEVLDHAVRVQVLPTETGDWTATRRAVAELTARSERENTQPSP